MAAEKHILVEAYNGLYCLSLETGNTLWQFTGEYNGKLIREGRTPAVDQEAGLIYYHCLGRVYKINALNGSVLGVYGIGDNHTMNTSGNTLLVNDAHGYFIADYYHEFRAYGGAIKVLDANLNLVWQALELNCWFKTILAYNDGVLYVGTGDAFQYDYNHEWYTGQKEDCRIIAYDITDGTVLWTWEADALADYVPLKNKAISHILYCNGYLIAVSPVGGGANNLQGMVFVVNASDGSLVKSYTHPIALTSCGCPAFSFGRLVKGNLANDKAEVIQIGTGAKTNYAPYGNHKLQQGIADDTALTSLDESISLVGAVSGTPPIGPAQGAVIYNGVAYVAGSGSAGGVVSFDIETLQVVREYDAGPIWDSSPMVVKNITEEDVLLVYRSTGKKVAAFDVASGDLLWETGDDIEGYLFFGFSYYESAFLTIEGGNTSVEMLKSINDNFTSLNALISDAAIITTVTSLVGWRAIVNTNIANLNTEGVAVTVAEITVGMTGQQVIDIINNFVIDYAEANS